MKRWMAWGAALALGLASPALAADAVPVGDWIGPHADVAVRTGPCGTMLCGWVVWASPSARAHAGDGGTTRLIGTELLEGYRNDGTHQWRGTVFVPDLGTRFASRIEQPTPDRLRIEGCMLGGLICRSQTWHRIDRMPGA